ncbi:hypothetical protein [Methylocapsa acidiphila]|uniref:hypothetical protein n=1 Tax=Methylocapsa acidiphila TaxID=133552 RepID=UPI00041843E5|nr:hypothetical protein [Methylocapsa acidiphila]
MSGQHSEEEAEARRSLLEKSKGLERLAETIFRAAEGRRDMPQPLADSLKQIGDLAAESEEAITAHLDDANVGEDLEAVATALSALRSAIDSLSVFTALEGSSYETRTVAND